MKHAPNKFERQIVTIENAKPDGWAEFWLSCGHGGRLLLGYPDGHLLMRQETTMYCWPCRRAAGLATGNIKLDVEKVREIRRRASAGETQVALARAYGVSQPTVSQIVQRATWKDLGSL